MAQLSCKKGSIQSQISLSIGMECSASCASQDAAAEATSFLSHLEHRGSQHQFGGEWVGEKDRQELQLSGGWRIRMA